MARDGVDGVRDALALGAAAPRQVHYFERRRHGWPVGYFDALVGERIPFPGPGEVGVPYTGILRSVSETPRWIQLEFAGVERERVEEGGE